MGRFRESATEDSSESGIDMSPLIDCVFILLIFFIVTTTFVEETGVEVDKPQAASATRLEKTSILIALTAKGEVVYGGRAIGISGVQPLVKRMLQKENVPVIINEEIFDLAVNAYLRAMDQSPPSPPDRAMRAAKVLTARGALSQTQQLIERIEAVYGDQLDTGKRKDLLKLRARLAVANGASAEEVRVLEQIVALDPLDGETLILLGQHSSRAGEIEKAIFYYERAASLEKFEADAKVRHAQLLVKTGQYEEALRLLRRAQQLKPRDNIEDYLEQVERVAKSR